MARIRLTQRYPLGTRVRKYFKGYKNPFEGLVDHHSDQTNFYHISYDDGDSEEMTEDDVGLYLFSLPKPQRPSKTVKTTKPSKANKSDTPIAMKSDKGDNRSIMSSLVAPVPSSTASKGKRRRTLPSVHAKTPKLMHSNDVAGSSCSHEATSEPLTVSIPTNMPQEVKGKKTQDEKEAHEDEEVEDGFLLEGTVEEINLLIGKPVEKTMTKKGCSTVVVQGTVASFFPATKKFRVMYFDGECCDLSYREVFDSIPSDARPAEIGGKRKRKMEKPPRNEEKKKHSALSLSLKRPKTLNLNTNVSWHAQRSSMASPPSSRSPRPPSLVIHETDMAAIDNVEFNIVRKVLFIIVSTVKSTAIELQLETLSSEGLKDKEALEVFVQKGGLISLAELLSKWEDQVETEQGVLLVLKALAVLPGVTKDVIMDSRIGKKVRGIEKQGSYRDSSIRGLATWVIQKLKADVGVHTVDPKLNNGKVNRDQENYLRESNVPKRETSDHRGMKRDDRSVLAKLTDSSRLHDARLDKEKTPVISNYGGRSNSAKHLLSLMNSRNGRTSRRDRDIFGNVVTVGRLGTPNNWRARRSTVVLDQVSKRLTENAQEVEVVKTKLVEDGDWKPSKISFADEDAVCAFDKDIAVSMLHVFRPSGLKNAPGHLSVKPRSGPLRSILRVKASPYAAPQIAPQSNEKTLQSVPPTVHSTIMLESDLVAADSENLTINSEAVEDRANKLSALGNSKLLNAVSPTEKRKQEFPESPCIPPSEQPPLSYLDAAGGSRRFASGYSDVKLDPCVETPDNEKPEEIGEVLIQALSPVVSEDISSENGEVCIRDVNDSVIELDKAAPQAILPGLT